MRSSVRSCPAEKARPSPVSTTQRTASSASAALSASRSSACITLVKALSLSGRESVIIATPSTVSVRIAVNAMPSSGLAEISTSSVAHPSRRARLFSTRRRALRQGLLRLQAAVPSLAAEGWRRRRAFAPVEGRRRRRFAPVAAEAALAASVVVAETAPRPSAAAAEPPASSVPVVGRAADQAVALLAGAD